MTALIVGELNADDPILTIVIDIATNRKVRVTHGAEVEYVDKDDFQKAAAVFWDVFKVNGLQISKYNKCDDLSFAFENGSLQMKDKILICKNIFPTTYEFFYCLLEEYKRKIR